MKNPKKFAPLSAINQTIKNIKARAEKLRVAEIEKERLLDMPAKKAKKEKVQIELSPLSVFKSTMLVLAVFLSCWILLQINGILILFFVSFFIAAAMDPLIDFLQAQRIPRALGVLLVYVIVFMLVALLIASLLPLVAAQLFSLANSINTFIQKVSSDPSVNLPFGEQLKPYIEEWLKAIDFKVVAVQLQNSLQLLSSQLLNLGSNLWSFIIQISNGLMNFILVLILVFFMTVDENALENFCISVFPEKHSEYISMRLQMVKSKIGEWIRGQLVVSIVAALITFIGLAIANVEYSLLISVITGICMIVPVFGRVVAALIAVPIVMNQSPALALFLIIYFFAISQVENNIVVPLLMNKAVGLSPILIIFALLVGFQFLGILGLILAIPTATILAIFAKDVGKRIHARTNS
ncbi:AI-2E family transporter [Candidatus Peregrinibacteria bacterium]|nr:AI-2E family transporter [Candidatus Peregrinibacteria bacterium]